MYDVTHKYQFSSSSGALGKAVHNGERAIIYVTGNDVLRVKSKEKGWESIDSILYHMSDYINLNKESIGKAINRIV
jgi:phosphopantetheine adenylyltransferase